MNCVPIPDNVPVDLPAASSSVLTAVAPMVLPPSTVPVNIAPGSTTTRSANPALNCTAAAVPVMVPAFTTVRPAELPP
jgi:hypothetical protein